MKINNFLIYVLESPEAFLKINKINILYILSRSDRESRNIFQFLSYMY